VVDPPFLSRDGYNSKFVVEIMRGARAKRHVEDAAIAAAVPKCRSYCPVIPGQGCRERYPT
jgi:hypothetical protein